MTKLKNRYEFMFFLSCANANPNGDPDRDNDPRTFLETNEGYMTNDAINSRIRQYISTVYADEPGRNLFMQQGTFLNRKIAQAKDLAGVKLDDETSAGIEKSRLKACEVFWDVRTFGSVMSTGPNAGQVTGPVHFSFPLSIDPVEIYDIGITRCAATGDVKGAKSVQDYIDAENEEPESKKRTMGRKKFVRYAIYEVHGYISAHEAQRTGFSEEDLSLIMEACANMYEVSPSASKRNICTISPVIIFKHCGDPSKPEKEQERQAMLGRASFQTLFDLVHVGKKEGIEYPCSPHDYDATIDLDHRPKGIDVGFLMPFANEIVWNKVPEDSSWLKKA